MTDTYNNLATALGNANAAGQVLDVSNIQADGTGTMGMDPNAAAAAGKAGLEAFPVVSNSGAAYRLAMQIFSTQGTDYTQMAAAFEQSYPQLSQRPLTPTTPVMSPRGASPRAPSPRAASPRAPSPQARSPARTTIPMVPVVGTTSPTGTLPVVRSPSPRAPSPRAPSPAAQRTVSPRAASPRMTTIPTVPVVNARAPSPRAPSPRAPSPVAVRAPSPVAVRAPSPPRGIPTMPAVAARAPSPPRAIPTILAVAARAPSPPRAIPTMPAVAARAQSPPRVLAPPTVPSVTPTAAPKVAKPTKSPRDKFVEQYNAAVQSGKYLDVSKLNATGKGSRRMEPPKTDRGTKKSVPGFAHVLSDNYPAYQMAMSFLGPEYAPWAQQFVSMYGGGQISRVTKAATKAPSTRYGTNLPPATPVTVSVAEIRPVGRTPRTPRTPRKVAQSPIVDISGRVPAQPAIIYRQ